MLHYLVGLIIYVLTVCALVVLFKVAVKKTAARTVSIILAVLAVVALSIFPIENLFVTFKSPQSAFSYSEVGKIVDIAEDSESAALILTRGKHSFSNFYLRKADGGYKLCAFYESQSIAYAKYKDLNITVVQMMGTEDYYLEIFGTGANDIAVSDSLGTAFDPVFTPAAKTYYVTCVESIDFSEDYEIFIGGEKVTLTLK